MKKISILFAALSIVLTIQAESPEKISYQAIIRNTKGELVKNQAIGMKISIYFYNKTVPVISYAETQTPTTDENGLVSIEIGTGKVVTGIFADINWAARPYYLKTEIDPGGRTSYSITSDTQILSVPYALHAKTVGEIPDNSVTSAKIATGAVTASKISSMGATAGQVMSFSGTAWTPTSLATNPWQNSGSDIYFNTGKVGIGINIPNGNTSPDATLDVEGTVVIGASGKVFSEIREITGTSEATGSFTILGYPTGYTKENTRILSAEINYNGTNWNTLGMFYQTLDRSVGCSLSNSGIGINYPEVAAYQSKAIRILLIKVQ